MKRLTQILMWLYPATWRNRYEVEFEALLEDVEPNWRTMMDISKGGAVAIQLRTLLSRSALAFIALTGLVY